MADEQKPGGSPAPAPPGAGDANPKAGAAAGAPKTAPPKPAAAARRPSRPPPWLPPPGIATGPRVAGQVWRADRRETSTYLGQNFMVAKPDAVIPILEYLKLEADFDYLVDITAVDWPKRAERFDLVYIVYSFSRNERVRIKT